MTFFTSILNYLGLRTQESYHDALAALTEQRDAFEEKVYDLRWQLEGERTNLHRALLREQASILSSAVAHEGRDAWKLCCEAAEQRCAERVKEIQEREEMHAQEMRDARLSRDILESLRRSICEQGEMQIELDANRVCVEQELAQSQSLIRAMHEDKRRVQRSLSSLEYQLTTLTSQRDQARDAAKEALQYKPLYFSALEDLKKLNPAG